ncbi:MAG: DoxX family protein [Campylobacterales bacterium]|nr:DoxX family protein [Campylobacterales bacterium]NQY54074.1 DoxX family protein [Campylobacteraceae bacterium]
MLAKIKNTAYVIFRVLLGILFVFGGYAHFTKTEFYLNAMPSYIPFHEFIVYSSGVIEILLGLLLMIPKTSQKAAIGIIILLIAIFPANINMYLNHQDFEGMSETSLLIRLPIQLVLIAWAYVYARKRI